MVQHELRKMKKTMENILYVLSKSLGLQEALSSKAADYSIQNGKKDQELLVIEDILRIFKISTSTYYRLVKMGKFKPLRIGNRHYYRRKDIETMFWMNP